jgi:putrescine transport system permease protein
MNALATLFISVVTIGVIFVNQFMVAKERRRSRDMQLAFAPAAVTPASGVLAS